MAADTISDVKGDDVRGTLPPGTRLRNYELIAILGHGTFGITYSARDTVLGREVAIKEYLPISLALREGGTTVVPRSTQHAEDFIWGRERFVEEARILVTLDGAPAVVRVLDFMETNGTAYMVMALVRGDTVDQRLRHDQSLPPAIVERMFARLLDGLEEVHKAGFLHRDIKPANIILDSQDNPTLIDFGASRASVADRSAAMTAIFTPRYAAAEQLTSAKQGPWTDIYGLSATLYHAITGRAPPSSLERALNDTYEPLLGLSPPGFSRRLLQAIDSGLAVRPTDRPQSIADWRRAMAEADDATGGPTIVGSPRRPPTAPQAPLSARARPAVAASPPPRAASAGARGRGVLFGGAALALVLLAAGGYWALAPKSAPTPVAIHDRKADPTEQTTRQDADARQRAEQEAKLKAEADAAAQRQAETEARQRARADAEAKQKAEAEERQKAEARQKMETELKLKTETAVNQKAEAEAQRTIAEMAEAALRMPPIDRQRAQVALTFLGFNTNGADGVFGPRTREMIGAWQKARGEIETGFFSGAQFQALLKEAAPAIKKFEIDQGNLEQQRRGARKKAADDAKKAASEEGEQSPLAAPKAGVEGTRSNQGITCQDDHGTRVYILDRTSCPAGLTAAP